MPPRKEAKLREKRRLTAYRKMYLTVQLYQRFNKAEEWALFTRQYLSLQQRLDQTLPGLQRASGLGRLCGQ
jgi:hypothetical protein